MPALLFFILKYVGVFGPLLLGLLLYVASRDTSFEVLGTVLAFICFVLGAAFTFYGVSAKGNKVLSDFCYVLAGQKPEKKESLEQVKKKD